MAAIKGIQNGSVVTSSGAATVTITAVDRTKAVLFFGLRKATNNQPRRDLFRGRFTSDTEIKFENFQLTGNAATIEWYVVEWTSGVTVQSGSTRGIEDNSITAVTLANAFTHLTWAKTGTILGTGDLLKGWLSSTTNFRIYDNDSTIGNNVDTDWFVVESTDFDVQTGLLAMTSETTADATITAVDLTKAFPLLSWSINASALANDFLLRGHFTSTTVLRAERNTDGPADPGTDGIRWQVVEITDGSTVQSGTFAFVDTDGQESATVTAVTNGMPMAAGFMGRAGESSQANDSPSFAEVTLDLTTSTNLQADRGATAGTADVEWFLIDWSSGAGPQTITGSLLSRSPTFPTGAANPGNVTLGGTLLSRSPTLPVGAVNATNTIPGSLLSRSPSFPAGTVTPGPVTSTGVLLSKSPTFPTGAVNPGNVNLGGVLLSRSPTFPTGVVSSEITLGGVLLARSPTFPVGSVDATSTLSGVLFSRSPTFPAGTVSSETTVGGVLLSTSPTFPTGAANPGNVTIGGTLLSRSPTFPTGTISLSAGPQTITGTLLSRTPTFPTGSVNPGNVTLGGVLLSRSGTFPTGTVTSVIVVSGVLLSRSPTFPVGSASSVITVSGVLLTRSPTFPTGSILPGAVTVTGVLLARSPTFPTGAVTSTITVSGLLLLRSPSFPTGTVTPGNVTVLGVLLTRSPAFPSGQILLAGQGWWTTDPAGHAKDPAGYLTEPAAYSSNPAGYAKTPVGHTKKPADTTW